jgi:hypothetical protein
MDDGELVQKYAKHTQDFDFTLKRAEELAAEVKQLRDEVRRASVTLSFDDEPSGFVTLLEKAAK